MRSEAEIREARDAYARMKRGIDAHMQGLVQLDRSSSTLAAIQRACLDVLNWTLGEPTEGFEKLAADAIEAFPATPDHSRN